MERIWKFIYFYIGLNIVELCSGLPINNLSAGGWNTQTVALLLAAVFSVCAVIFLIGCVCCQRREGFKEFRDSPVSASVVCEQSEDDPGHVNPIATSEFTIFTPLSPPHHNNNVFRSNQARVAADGVAEPACKVNTYGLDLRSWFDGSRIEFPRNKLKYIRELGSGWFGRVVEGEAHGITDEQGWTPVAVRILETCASAHEQAVFLHEASMYRLEQPHPNVLRLLGHSLEATPLLLIQEYCSKGDLKKFLLENGSSANNSVVSNLPLRFCCQLTAALQYLHEHNMPHPDLASRTCQLTSDLTVKLGDYGIAVNQYPRDYYQGVPAVPVRWCAPEMLNYTNTTLQPKQMTTEGNIWSLGITMWEICEWGNQPYDNLSDDEVISQVLGPPHLRLPKPNKMTVFYIEHLYRLMQLCWSTNEQRPDVNHIYDMLIHLLQVSNNATPLKTRDFSVEDFDSKWDNFKPNTIVKTDNELTVPIERITDVSSTSSVGDSYVNSDVKKSASLTNLHGSFDNLLTDEDNATPNTELDSWLQNVATDTGDMQYVHGLSQAIHALDSALASEQTSSSSSSYRPSPGPEQWDNSQNSQLKIEFKLGEPVERNASFNTSSNEPSSLMDSIMYTRNESGSETEDETWKKRIERGAYSEKVRQKSKSVADLMILTHIDCSDTDSETPLQSLEYKNNPTYKNVRCASRGGMENAMIYGSEGNLLTVQDTFQEELRKLKEERRDSLLFVPANDSPTQELETENNVATDNENTLYNVAYARSISDMFINSEIRNRSQEESSRSKTKIKKIDNELQTQNIEAKIEISAIPKPKEDIDYRNEVEFSQKSIDNIEDTKEKESNIDNKTKELYTIIEPEKSERRNLDANLEDQKVESTTEIIIKSNEKQNERKSIEDKETESSQIEESITPKIYTEVIKSEKSEGSKIETSLEDKKVEESKTKEIVIKTVENQKERRKIEDNTIESSKMEENRTPEIYTEVIKSEKSEGSIITVNLDERIEENKTTEIPIKTDENEKERSKIEDNKTEIEENKTTEIVIKTDENQKERRKLEDKTESSEIEENRTQEKIFEDISVPETSKVEEIKENKELQRVIEHHEKPERSKSLEEIEIKQNKTAEKIIAELLKSERSKSIEESDIIISNKTSGKIIEDFLRPERTKSVEEIETKVNKSAEKIIADFLKPERSKSADESDRKNNTSVEKQLDDFLVLKKSKIPDEKTKDGIAVKIIEDFLVPEKNKTTEDRERGIETGRIIEDFLVAERSNVIQTESKDDKATEKLIEHFLMPERSKTVEEILIKDDETIEKLIEDILLEPEISETIEETEINDHKTTEKLIADILVPEISKTIEETEIKDDQTTEKVIEDFLMPEKSKTTEESEVNNSKITEKIIEDLIIPEKTKTVAEIETQDDKKVAKIIEDIVPKRSSVIEESQTKDKTIANIIENFLETERIKTTEDARSEISSQVEENKTVEKIIEASSVPERSNLLEDIEIVGDETTKKTNIQSEIIKQDEEEMIDNKTENVIEEPFESEFTEENDEIILDFSLREIIKPVEKLAIDESKIIEETQQKSSLSSEISSDVLRESEKLKKVSNIPDSLRQSSSDADETLTKETKDSNNDSYITESEKVVKHKDALKKESDRLITTDKDYLIDESTSHSTVAIIKTSKEIKTDDSPVLSETIEREHFSKIIEGVSLEDVTQNQNIQNVETDKPKINTNLSFLDSVVIDKSVIKNVSDFLENERKSLIKSELEKQIINQPDINVSESYDKTCINETSKNLLPEDENKSDEIYDDDVFLDEDIFDKQLPEFEESNQQQISDEISSENLLGIEKNEPKFNISDDIIEQENIIPYKLPEIKELHSQIPVKISSEETILKELVSKVEENEPKIEISDDIFGEENILAFKQPEITKSELHSPISAKISSEESVLKDLVSNIEENKPKIEISDNIAEENILSYKVIESTESELHSEIPVKVSSEQSILEELVPKIKENKPKIEISDDIITEENILSDKLPENAEYKINSDIHDKIVSEENIEALKIEENKQIFDIFDDVTTEQNILSGKLPENAEYTINSEIPDKIVSEESLQVSKIEENKPIFNIFDDVIIEENILSGKLPEENILSDKLSENTEYKINSDIPDKTVSEESIKVPKTEENKPILDIFADVTVEENILSGKLPENAESKINSDIPEKIVSEESIKVSKVEENKPILDIFADVTVEENILSGKLPENAESKINSDIPEKIVSEESIKVSKVEENKPILDIFADVFVDKNILSDKLPENNSTQSFFETSGKISSAENIVKEYLSKIIDNIPKIEISEAIDEESILSDKTEITDLHKNPDIISSDMHEEPLAKNTENIPKISITDDISVEMNILNDNLKEFKVPSDISDQISDGITTEIYKNDFIGKDTPNLLSDAPNVSNDIVLEEDISTKIDDKDISSIVNLPELINESQIEVKGVKNEALISDMLDLTIDNVPEADEFLERTRTFDVQYIEKDDAFILNKTEPEQKIDHIIEARNIDIPKIIPLMSLDDTLLRFEESSISVDKDDFTKIISDKKPLTKVIIIDKHVITSVDNFLNQERSYSSLPIENKTMNKEKPELSLSAVTTTHSLIDFNALSDTTSVKPQIYNVFNVTIDHQTPNFMAYPDPVDDILLKNLYDKKNSVCTSSLQKDPLLDVLDNKPLLNGFITEKTLFDFKEKDNKNGNNILESQNILVKKCLSNIPPKLSDIILEKLKDVDTTNCIDLNICNEEVIKNNDIEEKHVQPNIFTSTPFLKRVNPKPVNKIDSIYSYISEGDENNQSSVILGPCEDYTLELFSGLKTTFGKYCDDDRPEEEILQFSSNFMPFDNEYIDGPLEGGDSTTAVDYSIETWDKFLGKTLEDNEKTYDTFSPRLESLKLDESFIMGLKNDNDNKTIDLSSDNKQNSASGSVQNKNNSNDVIEMSNSFPMTDNNKLQPNQTMDTTYEVKHNVDGTFSLENKDKVKMEEKELNDELKKNLNSTFDVETVSKNIELVVNATYALDKTFINPFDKELNKTFDKPSDTTFDKILDKTFDKPVDKTIDKPSDKTESASSCNWEPGEGWFLHPQTPPEDLTGQIDISAAEDIDNSYVGFTLDEECVNALRSELAAKLPHAQGLANEEQEPEDWDAEERNEVVVKYNVYATPLSPIPEESCCDDMFCDQTQHRDGSDTESEWSEPGRTSHLEDILIVDTETHTAMIFESPSPREPLNRHTPSQDSCCSNDTLFNLEDLNYGPMESENSPIHTQIIPPDVTETVLQIVLPNSDENTPKNMSVSDYKEETTTKEEITTKLIPQDDIIISESQNNDKKKLKLNLEPGDLNVAPLPSPEDIPWRQLPASMLTYSQVALNDTYDMPESENTGSGATENTSEGQDLNLEHDFDTNGAKEEPMSEDEGDLYNNLTDIRFSGPCDTQLMSTSFSESAEIAEDRDWDSGSDTRSSSSGEFIWKEGEHEESLRALNHDEGVPESVSPMEAIAEENSDTNDEDDDDDEEIEETEFVPSAWDSQATPTKSALRSPEKSNKQPKNPKGVWFKKEKYHCVYEYPREPESPVPQSSDLWRPLSDFANYADLWELDPESCIPAIDDDGKDCYEPSRRYTPRDYYQLASGSSQHRDLYQLNSFPDFSSGTPATDEDFFISSSAKPFQTLSHGSQFFPGHNNKTPHWADYQTSSLQSGKDFSDNITPDSGIDDITPASISEQPSLSYAPMSPPKNTVQTLKSLAALAANKTNNNEVKQESLGGLRHTRSRLKLDLPPSPSSFTATRSFNIELNNDPIVNREVPTFTTFGKSRFSVQHVQTPTEDDNLESNSIKNVSFEALPHKPFKLEEIKTKYVTNMPENIDDKHKPVEVVRGEASLLDSADEDSGIESSANATLERQQVLN